MNSFSLLFALQRWRGTLPLPRLVGEPKVQSESYIYARYTWPVLEYIRTIPGFAAQDIPRPALQTICSTESPKVSKDEWS